MRSKQHVSYNCISEKVSNFQAGNHQVRVRRLSCHVVPIDVKCAQIPRSCLRPPQSVCWEGCFFPSSQTHVGRRYRRWFMRVRFCRRLYRIPDKNKLRIPAAFVNDWPECTRGWNELLFVYFSITLSSLRAWGTGEGFSLAENREHNTLSAFPGIFLPSTTTTDPTHSPRITRCGHAAEAGVAAEILLYDHWCALSSIYSRRCAFTIALWWLNINAAVAEVVLSEIIYGDSGGG
jgi:hypothetical protein